MTAPDSDGSKTDEGQESKTLRDAGRADKWSVGWIMVAVGLWMWFAFLMLSSYGPESHDGVPRCEGPLIAPFQRDGYFCDSELRQWPALLGILGLSSIATAVAAATTVYAKLLSRMAKASAPGADR
ncbi:hypothetical protein [Streptomyces pactum]|uniref:Uncharacterized protein n=1 Tax=Streptomyces pactum TaxID=68249 RepID=A0A1S6J8J6_9ACTN|nr:hypothetical protein [Streptomyces pactum]AQS68078.1 hypothetical protein B1H29_15050 [Streptomyces pactum]